MHLRKNIQLTGAEGRPFLMDLYTSDNPKGHLIILCHGFKGFKDWGCWHEMAKYFTGEGYHFIKFNYSHNGTTVDHPMEFEDLDAFGRNTFSKELIDLGKVIQRAESLREKGELDFDKLHLIGHSRSGPIVIVKGLEDDRVATVTTWAGVSDLKGMLTRHMIEEWKRNGVIYIANARTGQQMPLSYDLYLDYMEQEYRFDLAKVEVKRRPPMHFLHGDQDEAVPYSAALELKSFFPWAKVDIIPETGHTFDCRHPQSEPLPPAAMKLLTLSSEWILSTESGGKGTI